MKSYLYARYKDHKLSAWTTMDKATLPDFNCRYNGNGLHMLLAKECLTMGFVSYWSKKDAEGGRLCLLDGLRCRVMFKRQ